jgi:hypothetical protein
LRACLEGVPRERWPYDYPDLATRFERYAGWLETPGVLAVRFEDLVGAARATTVRRIVDFWAARAGWCDVDAASELALGSIRPERSHTFREGRVGGWRESFSPELRELGRRILGPLLVRLGYEVNTDW